MEREEYRTKCCLAMGEELGFIYERLDNQLCWILMQLTQFTELFSVSQDRIDLMNKSCNTFFNHFQIVQLNHIHISIATCFDAPSMQKNQNISIKTFPSLIDKSIKEEVNKLLNDIQSPLQKLIDRRNKQLVHFDLDTATNNINYGVSISELREILENMGEILNTISSHYMNNTTTHYNSIEDSSNALAILYCMNDTVLFREAHLERTLANQQSKYDHQSDQYRP
jgi:hypothetical protein